MKKDINKCIEIYKRQLEDGNIQSAYRALIKYIAELKAKFPNKYKTGYTSPGYLDYTYFPFFNDYLRAHKLRFGVILNHREMKFELWLMGQNASVQKEYWEVLKETKWNEGVKTMPKYSVLELPLIDKLDFENKERMTIQILGQAIDLAKEVQAYLEKA